MSSVIGPKITTSTEDEISRSSGVIMPIISPFSSRIVAIFGVWTVPALSERSSFYGCMMRPDALRAMKA